MPLGSAMAEVAKGAAEEVKEAGKKIMEKAASEIDNFLERANSDLGFLEEVKETIENKIDASSLLDKANEILDTDNCDNSENVDSEGSEDSEDSDSINESEDSEGLDDSENDDSEGSEGSEDSDDTDSINESEDSEELDDSENDDSEGSEDSDDTDSINESEDSEGLDDSETDDSESKDSDEESDEKDFKKSFADEKKSLSTSEETKSEPNPDSTETKETRDLTDDEKQKLKDLLGWTDKQISKCSIDEDGVIHYKTDREDLEGKTSENGVKYERKLIEINGIKIEGVFPIFDSKFDANLPDSLLKSSNPKQFKECNRQLKEAVDNDPDLKKQFTDEQLDDIKNGDTPEGYTWHHNEETGKMQLVKTEDHDRTQGGAAHTGGKALWGGKTDGADNVETNQKDQDNSEV